MVDGLKHKKPTRRKTLASLGTIAVGSIAGCFTNGSSGDLSSETIRIGILTRGQVGPLSESGRENGMRLATSEIMEQGGIAGADIKLFVKDTHNSDSNSLLYNELIQDHNVDATMGFPAGLYHNEPLWPIKRSGIVHVTLGTWGTRISSLVSKNYGNFNHLFRIGMPNGEELGNELIDYIENNKDELGWEKAAVYIHPKGYNDAARSFGEVIKNRVDDVLNLYSVRDFSDPTHLLEYYDELEENDVDVLLTGVSYGGMVTDRWQRHGKRFDLGGLHLPGIHENYWNLLGGACEGLFSFAPLVPSSVNGQSTQEFVKSYNREYGIFPPIQSTSAYDAMHIYAQAVEDTVERTGKSQKPSQSEVSKTLQEGEFDGKALLENYQLHGSESNYPNEPIWQSMTSEDIPVIMQWQKEGSQGKRAVLAPDHQKRSPSTKNTASMRSCCSKRATKRR